jgi:hypothetical protein
MVCILSHLIIQTLPCQLQLQIIPCIYGSYSGARYAILPATVAGVLLWSYIRYPASYSCRPYPATRNPTLELHTLPCQLQLRTLPCNQGSYSEATYATLPATVADPTLQPGVLLWSYIRYPASYSCGPYPATRGPTLELHTLPCQLQLQTLPCNQGSYSGATYATLPATVADPTVPDNKSRNIPEVVLVRRWAVGVLAIWRGGVSWVKGGANGVSLQAT